MILAKLGTFFESNIGAIVKHALTAIGVGVISYAAVTTAFQSALTLAQSHFNSISNTALQVANLAGIGEGLGIITAGMLVRIALSSGSKLGVLPK